MAITVRLSNALTKIDLIPLSRHDEFDLTDKEITRLRQRLYAINKDGIRQYMTRRYGSILWVWRVR